MDFARLAQQIADRDIKFVAGIPGSGTTLSLIDEMEKRGVDFYLTRFEGTGALIAGTAGRLSGQAGMSLSIKGPGLANAVPGLSACWFEAFPVVHLTEAVTPGTPLSKAHKRLNHHELVSSISKGCYAVPEGSDLSGHFRLAESEEPGPVVAELIAGDSSDTESIKGHGIDESANGGQVLQLIEKAKRPVVIAGTLAIRKGWGKLLNRLNIPIFSTAAAKGVVDETLACAAGVYTGTGAELTHEYGLLPEADLVIGLGLTAREVLSATPFSCKSVNLAAVNTPGQDGFNFEAIAGIDIADNVMEQLSDRKWGVDQLAKITNKLHSAITEGFLPGMIFNLINDYYSGQCRAVMDTGYFCTIGEHAWLARNPDWCLLSGQGRYMGTGLPMALGAALYDRIVPTIAFLGDGGISMYISEARLAVQQRLPLLIVLMTDNAFGSIRTRAIKDGLTQKPLIMDGSSWVSCFEAMGISGTRAENLPEVEAALKAWKTDCGPCYLEIAFDAARYERMTDGIR